jgi:hypothetical protein
MSEPGELQKDMFSTMPLAPGGVYSVAWEQRMKWTDMIEVEPVDYTPPYPVNPSNPRCYLVGISKQEYAPEFRQATGQVERVLAKLMTYHSNIFW